MKRRVERIPKLDEISWLLRTLSRKSSVFLCGKSRIMDHKSDTITSLSHFPIMVVFSKELMPFCKGCDSLQTSITPQRSQMICVRYVEYPALWAWALVISFLPPFSLTAQYRYGWNGRSWTKGNPCSYSGVEFTDIVFLADAKCNADTAGPSSGRLCELVMAFPRATR